MSFGPFLQGGTKREASVLSYTPSSLQNIWFANAVTTGAIEDLATTVMTWGGAPLYDSTGTNVTTGGGGWAGYDNRQPVGLTPELQMSQCFFLVDFPFPARTTVPTLPPAIGVDYESAWATEVLDVVVPVKLYYQYFTDHVGGDSEVFDVYATPGTQNDPESPGADSGIWLRDPILTEVPVPGTEPWAHVGQITGSVPAGALDGSLQFATLNFPTDLAISTLNTSFADPRPGLTWAVMVTPHREFTGVDLPSGEYKRGLIVGPSTMNALVQEPDFRYIYPDVPIPNLDGSFTDGRVRFSAI